MLADLVIGFRTRESSIGADRTIPAVRCWVSENLVIALRGREI
jgi:hypothetical protein